MTSTTTQFEETLQKVRHIVADKTGNDIEEVFPQALLEDLNLYGPDLKRVVVAIGKAFGVYLYTQDIEAECETIHDLAMIVHEESVLG